MPNLPSLDPPPGRLLRRIAERFASEATRERVLFPLLADLQFEHANAPGRWSRAFVRARGVLAFWRVLGATSVLDAGRHLWANAWGTTEEESKATKRLLVRVGMGATVVTTLLLGNEYPRLRSLHLGSGFFLLIPSILPVALPMGTLFAFALQARLRMAEQRTTALRVVTVAGLASFASAAWFAPAANQEFRQRVYWTVAPESRDRPLPRGDREMTLDELAVRSGELRSSGRGKETARFELEWHKKPALAGGCLALALAGIAIASTLRRTLWRFVASIGALNGYYALERIGEQSADAGQLAPALAMWGPIALITVVSLALLSAARTNVEGVANP